MSCACRQRLNAIDVQFRLIELILVLFSTKMKRIIDPALENWKHSPTRKPLIIRGARQVGVCPALKFLPTMI